MARIPSRSTPSRAASTQFAKTDAAHALSETRAALERLARDDPEQHDLYVARSRAIAALAPAAGAAQEAARDAGAEHRAASTGRGGAR